MRSVQLLIIFLVFIVCPGYLWAETKTVEESCEYVMGDNDAKIDARRLCLIEAKRKVLEKTGTYIESNTNVLNFNLTRDEIRTYTSGLVKTDIVSEETTFNGQSTVIRMKIRADVDASMLASSILEIHRNKDLANKYRQMEADYTRLEKQIQELQDKLRKGSDWASIEKARLERENAFNRLSALEKVKIDIKQKTYLAAQNIEIGMTRNEVIKLCGSPRAYGDFPYEQHLNYGDVWVVIENNIVTLLVQARCFKAQLKKEDYFNNVLKWNPCGPGKGIVKY